MVAPFLIWYSQCSVLKTARCVLLISHFFLTGSSTTWTHRLCFLAFSRRCLMAPQILSFFITVNSCCFSFTSSSQFVSPFCILLLWSKRDLRNFCLSSYNVLCTLIRKLYNSDTLRELHPYPFLIDPWLQESSGWRLGTEAWLDLIQEGKVRLWEIGRHKLQQSHSVL